MALPESRFRRKAEWVRNTARRRLAALMQEYEAAFVSWEGVMFP
jgi:hypothetical protein